MSSMPQAVATGVHAHVRRPSATPRFGWSFRYSRYIVASIDIVSKRPNRNRHSLGNVHIDIISIYRYIVPSLQYSVQRVVGCNCDSCGTCSLQYATLYAAWYYMYCNYCAYLCVRAAIYHMYRVMFTECAREHDHVRTYYGGLTSLGISGMYVLLNFTLKRIT